MISGRWKHLDLFSQAWSALGVEVDFLFVPPAMLPNDEENESVCSNEHTEMFRAACKSDSVCWVHGSSSPCIKNTLRDRQLTQCFVSDVVRSDSSIAANPSKALYPPLGALCSDLCVYWSGRVDGKTIGSNRSQLIYTFSIVNHHKHAIHIISMSTLSKLNCRASAKS